MKPPAPAVGPDPSRRERGPLETLLHATGGGFLVLGGGLLAALLAQFVLARVLGVHAYGRFVYVTTWVGVLLVPACRGLDTAVVRFLPRYRLERDWGAVRGLLAHAWRSVLPTSLLLAAIVAAGTQLLLRGDSEPLARAFLVVLLILPLQALASVEAGVLRGYKRTVVGMVPVQLLRPLLLAGGVALLALLPRGARGASSALLLNAGAFAVALWVTTLLVRMTAGEEPRSAAPREEREEWHRVARPLLLVSGMRVVLTYVDVIWIGLLLGTTAAGVYGLATRLARLVVFGLSASDAIAAPLIAELHQGRRSDQIQRVVTFACRLALGTSLVIAVLLVVGRGLLLSVFGQDFAAAGPILVVLALGQLVNAWTGPVGQLLNMTGHERENARILLVTTLCNALLNPVAILLDGPRGAAWATAGTIALRNLWAVLVVRRRLGVLSLPFGGARRPAP